MKILNNMKTTKIHYSELLNVFKACDDFMRMIHQGNNYMYIKCGDAISENCIEECNCASRIYKVLAPSHVIYKAILIRDDDTIWTVNLNQLKF